MKNQLKKVKFIQLRASGKTFDEIATELNISKPTLIKWSKELNCELNNEIEIYKDRIKKTLNLTLERELEIKSKILDKLEHQINNSDFSDIPLNKVIELALKIVSSNETKISLSESVFIKSLLKTESWEF